MKQTTLPEWSHKIDAHDIGLTPVKKVISASPQERKDLARRMQVESIEEIKASLILQCNPGNLFVHVTGELDAKLTQTCVVSLEPIRQEIHTSVEGWFASPESVVPIARARHEKQGRKSDAELPILEEKDDPEPIIDGEIDLGELATQHMALAIDPYPHKEGVEFERITAPGLKKNIPETRRNPFAALKDWKKSEKKDG